MATPGIKTLNTGGGTNATVGARGVPPEVLASLKANQPQSAIQGQPRTVSTLPPDLSKLLGGGINAGTQAKALGPGGGGGTGGGGGPVTSDVQVDPRQAAAHDALTKYANELAGKQHESITNAMQRERDATASQIADVRTSAGSRGAGPGSGVSSVLQTRAAMEGARRGQALNANLTDIALQQEGSARNAVMGGASDVAGANIARQNAATNLYNAVTGRQSVDNQMAIAKMQVPWQQQMDMLNLLMRSKSFLT